MNRIELKALTIKELKSMCKQKGLKGYSKLKEDELISLILGKATFKKIIVNPFSFKEKIYKSDFFELFCEDIKHPKIKNAIKNKLIERVK